MIWSNYFSKLFYLYILLEFRYFLFAFMFVSVFVCQFLYQIRFFVYMLAAFISTFYVENRLLPLHFIIFIIRLSWHIYLSMYVFVFFFILLLNSAFSSHLSTEERETLFALLSKDTSFAKIWTIFYFCPSYNTIFRLSFYLLSILKCSIIPSNWILHSSFLHLLLIISSEFSKAFHAFKLAI